MTSHREPRTLTGKPLYFSPSHAAYFETRHNLPAGSVAAAYRHHFGSQAADVLAELLANKPKLELHSNGEVVYPPDDKIIFGPRKPITGAERLARLEHAARIPKRKGAVKERVSGGSSTVAVADGSEGDVSYAEPSGAYGEQRSISRQPEAGSPRRGGRSAWERAPLSTGRVSKPTRTSPTTPRFSSGQFWREI